MSLYIGHAKMKLKKTLITLANALREFDFSHCELELERILFHNQIKTVSDLMHHRAEWSQNSAQLPVGEDKASIRKYFQKGFKVQEV